MESKEKQATLYAPAEKETQAEIKSSYHALKNNPLVKMFNEAMPDLSMILNKQRQLIYANSNLVKFLDIEENHLPLGERLGNLINCIHSEENSVRLRHYPCLQVLRYCKLNTRKPAVRQTGCKRSAYYCHDAGRGGYFL